MIAWPPSGVVTLWLSATAVHRLHPADVVNHDARATRCKEQSVLLAQAAASAADHGNLLVEPKFAGCHHVTGSSFMP